MKITENWEKSIFNRVIGKETGRSSTFISENIVKKSGSSIYWKAFNFKYLYSSLRKYNNHKGEQI